MESVKISPKKCKIAMAFAGHHSALLPSDIIDFAMFPLSAILAEKSFSVRCHVTSKSPTRARAVGKQISSYIAPTLDFAGRARI